MNRRVASFQDKYIPFLALKMAAAVHTGPDLEIKTKCQRGAELSDQTEVLVDSGWR